MPLNILEPSNEHAALRLHTNNATVWGALGRNRKPKTRRHEPSWSVFGVLRAWGLGISAACWAWPNQRRRGWRLVEDFGVYHSSTIDQTF